jgi:hypothetical protein
MTTIITTTTLVADLFRIVDYPEDFSSGVTLRKTMILLVIKIYHAYIPEDLQYYPDVISGRKNTIRKTTIPEEKYIPEDCTPEYLVVAIRNTLRKNGFFRSAA